LLLNNERNALNWRTTSWQNAGMTSAKGYISLATGVSHVYFF